MGSTRRRTAAGLLVAALALGLSALPPTSATGGTSRDAALSDATALAAALDAHLEAVNTQLERDGAAIRLYRSEALTIGWGQLRVGNRFKIYYGHRWVPGDVRRNADGDRLRYLVDRSDGATTSGLTGADTEAAADRAVATWRREPCLAAAPLVKIEDDGTDQDFIDGLLLPERYAATASGLADIIIAGWYPAELFFAWGGEFGNGIFAFSETYIFVDPETGEPTDVNRDGYADTALNEIYLQDGLPGEYYLNWGVDVESGGGLDVETFLLHEFGHSLGLGHFGPPPTAAMNPGLRNRPGRPVTYASDSSAICALYASWPKP